MKKTFIIISVLFIILFSVSCKGEIQSDKTIGISMDASQSTWSRDGELIRDLLEKEGYKVNLQFSEDLEDNLENQVNQIDDMINEGVDILIIASVYDNILSNIIEKSGKQEIPIIFYEKSNMDNDDMVYHSIFDDFQVGVEQGNYIVEKVELDKNKGPFYIELFAGPEDDYSAQLLYEGAISILEPYIENGQLIVKSGEIEIEKTSIPEWNGDIANSRMHKILTNYYDVDKVDIILSPLDSMSLEIIKSLRSLGYGT